MPGEALGPGDDTFAHDPTTNRTWMVYSSVAPGPGDLRLVSTRLAYSDDGGETFLGVRAVANTSTNRNAAPVATGHGTRGAA